MPAHQGRAVSYRPPRWDEHGRTGSIDVPAGCPLLIVEGDGACRREVAHLIDTRDLGASDQREAARRAAARDLDMDAIDLANMPPDGSPPDHDGWTAEEIPFNTAQRTWDTRRPHRLRHPGDPVRSGHPGRPGTGARAGAS